ncbi:16S rRNA (cytosine967-C5)-methyltransferase [Azospirillaceae bacterium]
MLFNVTTLSDPLVGDGETPSSDSSSPVSSQKPHASPQASNQSEARLAALEVLRVVLRRQIPLDDALEREPVLARLSGRDRAFARLLVATVLRRLGQIDEVITGFLNRPGELKSGTQDILRLGVAQLLFLETPAHAAVDTSVRLAERDSKTAPYKGLINGLLRHVVRTGAAVVSRQDAGRMNTPDWLWLAWRKAYGTGATRQIVEAHLREPPLDLTLRDSSEGAVWAERLGGALLPTGSVRCWDAGAVTALPGYEEGRWWVQDAAAALPARLLGALDGRRAIDICAAPGGKTAQLAAAGAQVLAVDRSEPRLKRLSDNLRRLSLSAETVCADATTWQPAELADVVLLDAPCSATGTIRRHPDIPHLKTEAEVKTLARVQRRLLTRAIRFVRPGGVIVYCVCSLQPEEGEAHVEALLSPPGGWVERFPIASDEVGGVAEIITERGDIRTFPHHLAEQGGLDGFYIARLRRIA